MSETARISHGSPLKTHGTSPSMLPEHVPALTDRVDFGGTTEETGQAAALTPATACRQSFGTASAPTPPTPFVAEQDQKPVGSPGGAAPLRAEAIATPIQSPIIEPEADKTYTILREHNGEQRPLSVQFSARLVALLHAKNCRFDLERGICLGRKGPQSLGGVEAEYETATGRKPPPWLVRTESSWAVPERNINLDLSEDGARVVLNSERWTAARSVEPTASQLYEVHTLLDGQVKKFNVCFTPRFVSWCQDKGYRVDLDSAAVQTPEGKIPFGDRDLQKRYAAEVGRPASPWQFPETAVKRFTVSGVPQGVLTLDYDFAKRKLVYSHPDGLQFGFAVLREHRNIPELPQTPSAMDKLDTDAWPSVTWMNVTLQAPDRESLQWALRAFQHVCGVRAQATPAAVRPGEVTVAVVPPGHHWTEMPQYPYSPQDECEQKKSPAVLWQQWGETTVFLPHAFLDPASGANADGQRGLKSCYHEFYHVGQQYYMTEDEGKVVDESFRSDVERGGPFQSVYGREKIEYLTTMAEEFEGTYGPDGPTWLRRTHDRLHDLLLSFTGRSVPQSSA